MEHIEDAPGKEVFKPQSPDYYREYFKGEGDKKTFFWVESLRNEVELLPRWKAVKEKAINELEDLPEDLIPQIFERVRPYVEILPTGHSKGHTLRDLITSAQLMGDPSLTGIDDVEKLVGILSGTFHDIGNSVVGRYEESKRYAGHAEVGAYLFGDLTKDLIPPSLLKLIQYSIAAHTHYTRDITITKKINEKDETLVRRPYEDAPFDGNRMGIWLARWADRADMQGIMGFVRHALTKSQPTQDYDISKEFHRIREDEKEDFKHHFNPVIRSNEERSKASDQDKTRDVLEHVRMFRDSALTPSAYSEYDSDFFRNSIVVPAANEQNEFIDAVTRETPVLSDEEIDAGFNRFYSICRIIEPGVDIDRTIELFKEKFALLSSEQRSRWANGFNLLPELYKRWYNRMEKLLSANAGFTQNNHLGGIFKEGNDLAKNSLQEFDPQRI